jgi:two-component system, NtrC family, response regulator AtoC
MDSLTRTFEGSGSAPLAVVVISRSRLVSVVLPDKPVVTFGRSPTCDVVINDDSVSRTHAVLHQNGILEDLGSRNGTMVQGRRLDRKSSAAVSPGSVFELGSVTLVLHRRASSERKIPVPTGLVIADPAMARLYAALDVFAPSSLPVLILGATGTGKEVFAEQVHARSSRASKRFVAINCAALTPSLVDSELFGHERGAFTGAVAAKVGLFEEADGGTVFLDELAELPLETQAKLLRVLENGEVLRVGSAKPIRVDVRLLAATNANIGELLGSGRLRRDLYFRLKGFTASLPALRERRADIVPLARFFIRRVSGQDAKFTPEVEGALLEHDWPGNVRELRHVIERAFTMAGGPAIGVSHLAIEATPRADEAPFSPDFSEVVRSARTSDVIMDREANERSRIEQALQLTSGNQTEAAKLLGISRRALLNKLDRFGFARPRKRIA